MGCGGMLFTLLPLGILPASFNISSLGYHSVRLSKADLLQLNLTGRFAVLLDVAPNSFIAEFYSSSPDVPDSLSLLISEFTVRHGLLRVIPMVRHGQLRFWLLQDSHCPEASNIAIVNTANSLQIDTDIEGTLCLFCHTGAFLYDLKVETLRGFPWISVFSSRGRGDPVKVCQGEADVCEFRSADHIFVSIKGPTKTALSYIVKGAERRTLGCSIAGIPTARHGSLAETNLGIDKKAEPWCASESNAIVQAAKLMAVVFLMVYIAAIFARRMVKRDAGFARGHLASHVRRSFEAC
jgi:hypothetical protein